MASPPMSNNTSGLDAFLPRVNPRLEDAGEIEEAAEREWMRHANRGHETWVRGVAAPPIKPHPTDNGKPMRDTRLWPSRA